MICLKKTLFIKNAAVLTVTGVVLRILGVVFKIWLTRKIGQAGIGLYQIVFSFYVLVSTFATTGISTAVTRLCGDELAAGNKKGIRKIVRFAVVLSLLLSLITMAILIFGSKIISKSVLFDLRASFSIKILSFSLPFMGICSCLRGYFIAGRKAAPPAVSQIIEQVVRILVVLTGINLINTIRLDIVCGIIMLGDTIAEFVSCAFLAVRYKNDLKKLQDIKQKNISKKYIGAKIREIALPITSGRYLNSLLRTLENVLVPKKLILNGCSRELSLAKFGMIKGSALPILFFPSALLSSISTLLLPELSVAGGKKQLITIKSTVEEVIITTSLAAYIISGLFFVFGREVGLLFYNNKSVGALIRVLSPLVPLMYLDSICDGMLKGLNKQTFTFFVSIIDSSLRLVFIVLFVPDFGLSGFVGIMYFSNAFTGLLNIGMLIKTSRADINFFKTVLFPICTAAITVLTVDTVIRMLPIKSILVYIILVTLISCPIYFYTVSKIHGRKILFFI